MRILIVSLLVVCSVELHAQSPDVLVGAGSTFAAPLYEKWVNSFLSRNTGMPIRFDAVGSGAGLELLEKKQTSFAASDFVPSDEYRTRTSVKVLPAVVGGVVPAYNLPGVQSEIRFTANVLAGIYLGSIRRWDDPELKAINRGVKLPSAEIVPLHRSDVSGSTHVWTDFLSVNPSWRVKFGMANSLQAWPVGPGAKFNEGVAEMVSQTRYALGYVEFLYALKQHLSFGAVQDANGKFVTASIDSLTAAAQALRPDSLSIVNAPEQGAYPIASLTWLVIPVELPAAQRQRLTEFLSWGFSEGQREAAALGYIALPDRIAQNARNTVEHLWGATN